MKIYQKYLIKNVFSCTASMHPRSSATLNNRLETGELSRKHGTVVVQRQSITNAVSTECKRWTSKE